MKKLFLIAGHSLSDVGACSLLREADEAIKLRDLVFAKCNPDTTQVFRDDDNSDLAQVVRDVNQVADKGDILLSIHFNAFNGSARGTEALVYHDVDECTERVAQSLTSEISEVLGTIDRGVKYENQGRHSRLAILNDTKTASILLEVCFVDNKEDVEAYKTKRELIANSIVKHLNTLRYE